MKIACTVALYLVLALAAYFAGALTAELMCYIDYSGFCPEIAPAPQRIPT
jgi:hypothetical protein